MENLNNVPLQYHNEWDVISVRNLLKTSRWARQRSDQMLKKLSTTMQH